MYQPPKSKISPAFKKQQFEKILEEGFLYFEKPFEPQNIIGVQEKEEIMSTTWAVLMNNMTYFKFVFFNFKAYSDALVININIVLLKPTYGKHILC